MQSHRRALVTISLFMLVMLGASFEVSEASQDQSRLVQASGSGSLKIGDEKFNLSAAVVKLKDDRKAEVTLISDITVFLTGTWSNHADSQQEIDLQITGGATAGGLEAAGKLLLSGDGKSINRLTLKGVSRTSKRAVEADFQAKQ